MANCVQPRALVAGCALSGLPPLSPFSSELLIVSALAAQDFASDTIHAGRFITVTISDEVRSLGTVALLMLFALIAFGGFMYRIGAMVWGTAGAHWPTNSAQSSRPSAFKTAEAPIDPMAMAR